jgi:hypothetical protein
VALKPGQCFSGWLDQLELHGPLCLLLHHNGPVRDAPASYDVTDTHLHHVTSAQLAVDGEVEEFPVSEASVLIKPEADAPDLLWFQRPPGADHAAFIPRSKLVKGRVHRRMPHHPSP